jgi:hypothetical protein
VNKGSVAHFAEMVLQPQFVCSNGASLDRK